MVGRSATVSSTTDSEGAFAVLGRAFSTDPITRWVWPDDETYSKYFPKFARAFAGGAFGQDAAHVAEEFAGVALWLPPGTASDEETMGALARESIEQARQEEVFGFMGQMGEYHPTEPHWYLPLIGVDPAHQGRGHGSALLEHALQICDSQHLPAYLEASSPRNRALYARHGFEQTGEIQHGSSPPMWPMYRKAR